MTNAFDNLSASLDAEETTLNDVANSVNTAVQELADLKAQLEGGVTPDQAAQLQSRIDAINANLTGVANVIDPAVAPTA